MQETVLIQSQLMQKDKTLLKYDQLYTPLKKQLANIIFGLEDIYTHKIGKKPAL